MADENRMITFNYARTTWDAYKKQTIPDSKECMTKQDISNYLNADMSYISSYANNQLVPRSKFVGVTPNILTAMNIRTIIPNSSGDSLILGGNGMKINNTNMNYIGKVAYPSLAIDTSFINLGVETYESNTYLNRIRVDPDTGKYLLCLSKNGGGVDYNNFIRLNTDGSRDMSFNPVSTRNKDEHIFDCLTLGGNYYTGKRKFDKNGVEDTNYASKFNPMTSSLFAPLTIDTNKEKNLIFIGFDPQDYSLPSIVVTDLVGNIVSFPALESYNYGQNKYKIQAIHVCKTNPTQTIIAIGYSIRGGILQVAILNINYPNGNIISVIVNDPNTNNTYRIENIVPDISNPDILYVSYTKFVGDDATKRVGMIARLETNMSTSGSGTPSTGITVKVMDNDFIYPTEHTGSVAIAQTSSKLFVGLHCTHKLGVPYSAKVLIVRP